MVEGLPLDYDEELLEELRRVYGRALATALRWLLRPPERYYVRVNVARTEPGYVLDWLRSQGYEAYRDEVVQEAVWLPVRGPNRVSESAPCRVVVDKRAAESVMLGAHVYAPGVLGLEGDCRPGVEATVVSDSGVAVAEAVVRDVDSVERGRGIVAENVKPLYMVPSLRETELYRRGLIYEQSLPSIMVGVVALESVKPRLVVDMCAAPGGKATHVASLVKGYGVVYAFDHSRRKVERLREEVERLGLSDTVRVYRADSRYLDRDWPSLRGRVDLVLLDPPCSSIGVVPKVYDRKTVNDIISLSNYQRQFVRAAVRLLKPCGVLVYSTCTVTVTENEDVVSYAESLGLRLEQAWPRHPRSARGIGVGEALRFHPHVHGTPGYFIAVLRRPCSLPG